MPERDGRGTAGAPDPYLGFRYVVTLDDLDVAGFSEVSGLEMEVEVHEYREGGRNGYVHRLPGPVKYSGNLTLKRGLMDADALWEWVESVMSAGGIEPSALKSGSIAVQGLDGEDGAAWDFEKAYPVRWSGPDLSGGRADVAVETLELVHHGLSRSL